MEMNKKQKEKAVEITNDILFRIKHMFAQHRTKVDKLNQQNKYGVRNMKNDISHQFYSKLNTLSNDLKNLSKRVKGLQKFRKERAEMYAAKISVSASSLENLSKLKSIKIKLNDYVANLVEETSKLVDETNRNIRAYEKETGICGKSWDFKPALQKSLMEMIEFGKLWTSLDKFQSVTGDSVKEIYYPVQYDETVFKDIQNQIIRLWPAPVVVKQNIKIPQVVKNDCQVQEAHELLLGLGRSQQVQHALKLYKTEVEKPNCHPAALNVLGCLYEEGKYVIKDVKKAFGFYNRSSKLNDAEGLYKVGKYLEKGYINSREYFDGLYPNRQSEIIGGIQYYEKAAKLGHLDAITDLGYLYEQGVANEDESGYYIEPHPEYALKYYTKAKQSQFPRAFNNLGALYIRCYSLPEQIEGSNLQKGIKYLEKAVKLKYPKSFINLGKCYETGVGVTQNLDRARALYLQGSQLGDIQCKLQYVKSHLGSSLDDQKTMIKLVQTTRQVLLVQKYNAEALYFMGLFLQKGIGVDRNKQSSFYYMESAARLDYPPALTKLGDYYYSGYHVNKNIQFAKSLYEKSAKKNNSQALVNLGVLIEKGLDDEQTDPNRAQDYYKEAIKMGNTNALLLIGLDKERKTNQIQMVERAAEMGNINAIKLLQTNKNFLLPKKMKEKTTYDEAIKKMSTLSSGFIKKATKDNYY